MGRAAALTLTLTPITLTKARLRAAPALPSYHPSQARPELNGEIGLALRFAEDAGRWMVTRPNPNPNPDTDPDPDLDPPDPDFDPDPDPGP